MFVITGLPPCGSELARDDLKDNACFLATRGAPEFIASKLAPRQDTFLAFTRSAGAAGKMRA